MAEPLTHNSLCEIAVRWLRRPFSQLGPDCAVTLSEVKSGWAGEAPDAIGWRSKGDEFDGSVVVECKVSRSDFLADKKKPHRQSGGIGNWRYYMCPEGLISPDELPEKWGLLYVNARGHVKVIAGPAVHGKSLDYALMVGVYVNHQLETDYLREQFVLVRLLNRVGDPHKFNNEIKKLNREVSSLNRQLESHKARAAYQSERYSQRISGLKAQLTSAGVEPDNSNAMGFE
jgi:hypothetical protein